MNNELIKVNYDNKRPTILGRDLHKFLENKERYSKWITRMINYGFKKDIDFTTVQVSTLVNNGAEKKLNDIQMTTDMAKQISMIQKSKKGTEAREYFIKCEEIAKKKEQSSLPKDYISALELLVKSEKEKLIMEPKADYYDKLIDTKYLTGVRMAGVQCGIGQNNYVRYLLNNKFLYRNKRGDLIAYSQFATSREVDDSKPRTNLFCLKDWANRGAAGIRTFVTIKGKKYFLDRYNKEYGTKYSYDDDNNNKKNCTACSGSGWYDDIDENGDNILCGACDGTGIERSE